MEFATDRAWIELDREALWHNVKVLWGQLGESCQLMPAVKANAYGHGAVEIAGELNRMGVEVFCVASAGGGVQLREGGIKGDILILGYTHPHSLGLLGEYDLIQTVVDYPYALELNRYGERIRVHIGIDTGMHRLGVGCGEISHLCEICGMENLAVEGAFTHLCAADMPEAVHRDFTRKQAAAFYEAVKALEQRGWKIPKKHLLASSGIWHYPEFAGDYARAGIALYGVCGEAGFEESADKQSALRPVLSLKTRVASVREVSPGEGVGYGLAFRASEKKQLAVLTIGYGDGLPRSLSCGVGEVLVRGYKAPIVGRICMDQAIVDVTDISGVRPGDVAVIIGSMGEKQITAQEVARRAGTIPNEILSCLGSRLERVWA